MHIYSPVILNPSIVSLESCIFVLQPLISAMYTIFPVLQILDESILEPLEGYTYITWTTIIYKQVLYGIATGYKSGDVLYLLMCLNNFYIHCHACTCIYPTHRVSIRAKVWFSFVYTLGCTEDIHVFEEVIKVSYEFPCFHGLLISKVLHSICNTRAENLVMLVIGVRMHTMYTCMNRTLAKEGPLRNVRPPPTLGSISC